MKKDFIILIFSLSVFQIALLGQRDSIEIPYDTLKPSFITPVYKITAFNFLLNRIDLHIRQKEWANVSPSSWWVNIRRGFITDGDPFTNNWFGHPLHGAWFYNASRSSGLNFWQSLPYVFGGNLMWEYFGETEPPSIIDLYTTTFGGIYMGEMLYRFSDYLYNYPFRKNRKIHRIAAGIVNPYFGLNSLIFGTKIPATSKSEIPISGHLFMGSNHPFNLWIPEMKGTSAIIELQLEYGSLLDRNISSFSPFDYFTLRSWIDIPSWEESRAAYFNLSSHAIIYGKKTDKQT
jgi:hypothetical protein